MSKYILLHISEQESETFLTDAFKDGVERGLFMRSDIKDKLSLYFTKCKDSGYFPVGIIVDDNSNNIEFLFHRHPQQTKEQTLAEFKSDTPNKL